MGCWDIYCFLCGNPCHSMDRIDDKEIIDNYENKNVYRKYQKDPKLFMLRTRDLNKKTLWLDKCTFLAANDKIIHGCNETTCNTTFIDKNNNKYKHQIEYNNNMMHGVFVHTDCWKYINNEYNIELSYSYLPITKKIKNFVLLDKMFDFINYGKIEKYWNQFFDFIQILIDGNEELCYSPLKSELVASNIKKVVNKLKIKIDGRIGPVSSASFYEDGMYKIGNDKNIWIKKKKWIKKQTVKCVIKNMNDKIKKNIVYAGETTRRPFFIINIKNDVYEILTIENSKCNIK